MTTNEDALPRIDDGSSQDALLPPARFLPAAKAEWATAPETLRAEVLRLEAELTAVKEALARYVNLENQLRVDPIRGLEIICQNIGMSLRDVAALLGVTPGPDSTHDVVAEFAATHPRFDELSEDIVFLLETARANDLAEAYSLAERLNRTPDQDGWIPA